MDCPICKSENDPKNKFCIICGMKISDIDFINNTDFVDQKPNTLHSVSKSIQIINSPDAVASLEGNAYGRDESFNYKSKKGLKNYFDDGTAQHTNSEIGEVFGQEKSSENKKSEMRYVEPEHPRTVEIDPIIKEGFLIVSHKWARSSQSIARAIPKSEMGGWLIGYIIVQPNEVAVIVKDGKAEKVVDGGKVSVVGLLKINNYFKNVDVVMMDTSSKDANWQVGKLWTRDKHEVAAKGLLRYRIADPKKFFSMVYAYGNCDEKRVRSLTLEDINERIKSEVLTRVLQPEVNGVKIEEFTEIVNFSLK